MSAPPTRCWTPSAEQTLLLRAAMLSGEPARQAYAAWRRVADLDTRLDEGSARLLPRLYRNLVALGISDGETARLRGIHRQSRVTSALLGRLCEIMLRAFAAAGIEVCVLKGAALAPLYYGDPGERPLHDLDLLVRPADARGALEVLGRLGSQPSPPLPAELWPAHRGSTDPAREPIGHGWSFSIAEDPRARPRGLDLHWYAIPQSLQPGADDRFWTRSVPFVLGDASARTLAPSDHVLHALAHGVMWNTVPSIRWVADVMSIAGRATIDWSTVAAEAEARGLVLPVRETVAWLTRHMGLRVPAEVEARLAAHRVGPVDRWRYAHALHPWDHFETFGHVAFDCFRYVEGRPLHEAPATVGGYLERRWGTTNPLRIALATALRRLRA